MAGSLNEQVLNELSYASTWREAKVIWDDDAPIFPFPYHVFLPPTS